MGYLPWPVCAGGEQIDRMRCFWWASEATPASRAA